MAKNTVAQIFFNINMINNTFLATILQKQYIKIYNEKRNYKYNLLLRLANDNK